MKNKKKIIFEIIIIALSFGYLSYFIINKYPIINNYLLNALVLINILVFSIKNLKELDFSETKYDKYKIIFLIYLLVLLIFTILNMLNILNIVFYGLLYIFISFIMINFTYYIKKYILNDNIDKNKFLTNYSSFIGSIIIVICLLML
jgi:hypothetical protein